MVNLRQKNLSLSNQMAVEIWKIKECPLEKGDEEQIWYRFNKSDDQQEFWGGS